MDRDAVQPYVRRPWAVVEAAKQRFWADEYARRGPEATMRAAQALWVHMRSVRPDWPTEAERAEDLRHHGELKHRLDRAGRALGTR